MILVNLGYQPAEELYYDSSLENPEDFDNDEYYNQIKQLVNKFYQFLYDNNIEEHDIEDNETDEEHMSKWFKKGVDKYNLKQQRKNEVLSLVPNKIDKANVIEAVLNMNDDEFNYLASLRNKVNKVDDNNKAKVHKWLEINRKVPVAPPLPKPLPRYIEQRQAEIDNDIELMVKESERNTRNEQARQQLKQQKQTSSLDSLVNNFDARIAKIENSEKYFEDLINELYAKPFGTLIDLRKLDYIKDKNETKVLDRLTEWFNKNIANRLADRIYVRFVTDGHENAWDQPLVRVLDQVKKLLSEGTLLNIEEDNYMVNSGDNVQFYWNFVNNLEFYVKDEPKDTKGQRKSHANGFFPRKLKDEYQEFEDLLERYQIYHSYLDSSNKVKKDVEIPCLIHCLKLHGISSDLCNNILARIGHQKRFRRDMLGDLGKEFGLHFHVKIVNNKGEIDNANQNNKGWYGDSKGIEIRICEFLDHFFVDDVINCSSFAVKHWLEIKEIHNKDKDIDWMRKVVEYRNSSNHALGFKINNKKATCQSLKFVRELYQVGAFTMINADSIDVQKAKVFQNEVKEEDAIARPYEARFETKLITPKHKNNSNDLQIYYADFETCKRNVDGNVIAYPFMLCASNIDGTWLKTYTGNTCADDFLDDLPQNALVYYHNLGFDGNFFKRYGHDVMIQKGSKIMSMKCKKGGKNIQLRDSYSLLSKKLADFPKAFPNAFSESKFEKEVFPYDYYTYDRLFVDNELKDFDIDIEDAINYIKKDDIEQFKSNMKNMNYPSALEYCEFYCKRDVDVLRIGFNAFAESTLQDPINMNIHNFISAPSLAYNYMLEKVFYPNGKIYQVGGILQRYLQKFVYGGRVMCANNRKYNIKQKLSDFDACSLYPSAMRRAFTVEGIPEYYQNPYPNQEFNKHNLPEILTKAFLEDQIEPTNDRIYSQFFVEIEIVDIGIERAFPLIVKRENNKQSNVNECVKMYVDMIMLQDLIEFQDITFKFIDGYVMKGNRDHRIRETIKELYDLRSEYKKTNNPMQEVIKLIMNSAYGKSIQKVIKTDLRYVDADKASFKLYDKYYQIHKAEQINDKKWIFELYKQKSNQFNNAIFGITVLSMSKRIMNEVMCLAEDLNIKIYYQDTDSMHIEYDRVDELDEAFTKKYNRKLIGSNMGNFHTDFEPKNAYCIQHISLGKKMYLDVLEFEDDEIKHAKHTKNHIRMKGIPEQVIINHAHRYFNNDVIKLYEYIYNGGDIEFNLLDGKVCMKASRNGNVIYVPKFSRKCKATC